MATKEDLCRNGDNTKREGNCVVEDGEIHAELQPGRKMSASKGNHYHSHASMAKAGHSLMRFFKSCNGVGVFLGLLCAVMYSLGVLFAKVLSKEYEMHAFLLSAVRQFFLIFTAGPQVAYCKAPYGGRNSSEWIFLSIRAACGGIAIVLQFLALSHMTLGDVGVIFAVTPAFTTLFALFIYREKCHISDVPVLIVAFLGVAFILRPPIVFNYLFSSSLVASAQDVSQQDRLIGSAYALSGALIQSGLFLSLRKLRKVNYATISFYYAVSTAPLLIILSLAVGKLELPPGYPYRAMAIGIAVSAQFGHIFMTLAAKFIPPGIVSLTRSAEVAFGFLWQVVFLGVPINVFSMTGLVLVMSSMAFLSMRQVIIEKYAKEQAPNKFVKLLLFISK